MKKSFLVALLSLAVALPAAADLPNDTELKLEGMFNFEAGVRNQKKIPAGNNVTGNNKNSGINTLAFFAATALRKADDFEYGAKVVVQPTAHASSGVSGGGSHIFLINERLGKVELGSGFDAASQMIVTGLDVARGSGDGWSDYAYFGEHTTPSPYGFFLGSSAFKKDNTESSRKITYFTPKLGEVFTFGISYIPDTGNMGSASMSSADYVKEKARIVETDIYKYTEKKTSKNAVAVGVSLEHDLAEDVAIKVAVTGEYGKAAKGGVRETIDPADPDKKKIVSGSAVNYKLSSMRTYNIGAVLTYGNFSYGASYGDVKGFTSREVDGNKQNTRLYSTAIGYTQGPVGVSLSYLLTDARKNKVDAITVGTDYKLAPGLVPYAEVTYFKGRMHKLPVFNDPKKYTTKGTIALIGMKLKF